MIVAISFLLDGILSNIKYLIFLPLLTLTSLLVYRYKFKKNLSYLILLFIIGYLYDICYTDLYLVNACILFIIGLIINYLFSKKINVYISFAICILFYRTLSYLVYLLKGINYFDTSLFLKSIYSSFLLNICYLFILKNILKKQIKKTY